MIKNQTPVRYPESNYRDRDLSFDLPANFGLPLGGLSLSALLVGGNRHSVINPPSAYPELSQLSSMYNSNGLDDKSNQEIEAFQRAMQRPPELLRNAVRPRTESVPGKDSDNAMQAFRRTMQAIRQAGHTPPELPSAPPAPRRMEW